MVSYAYRKYDTIVSITTNGILLEKYAVDIIKSGLHLINVSLDAACPETYCKIRGNDYFEQIVAGINKINSIKAEMGSNLPVVGGHFVVQRNNYKEILRMINLANSLKMANLNFCALDFHNEENHSQLVGDMAKDSLLDELKRAHKYVNNGGVKTNLNIWLRDWEETWLKYTLDKPTPVSKRPCVRPWISVYISLLGEVTPCCKLTFGTSKVVFGNIFKQDFKELWNNEKAVSFRCMIRSGRKNIPVCDECVPLTILDKYHSFSKRNMLRNG
jgi:radical SAM protein with 4Fe4S-binding SPASM domain